MKTWKSKTAKGADCEILKKGDPFFFGVIHAEAIGGIPVKWCSRTGVVQESSGSFAKGHDLVEDEVVTVKYVGFYTGPTDKSWAISPERKSYTTLEGALRDCGADHILKLTFTEGKDAQVEVIENYR